MSELAVGYIRVSTDDQARHSPETQYNHIQNYIDAKEWRFLQKRLRKTDIELDERITDYTIEKDNEKGELEVPGIFTESGSGWTPEGRPVFEKIVDYVCENKEVKHIVFVWINRMARNFEDYVYLKQKLRKVNLNVYLHFIKEELVFDPLKKEDWREEEELEGALKKGKAFSGELSERVIDARTDRFKEGRVTYKVPYGYVNKIEPDTRRPYVEVVEAEAKKVKEIYEMMASGKYTILSLTKALREQGLKKNTYSRTYKKYSMEFFSHCFLYDMLRNETYLGMVKWRGQAKASSEVPVIIEQGLFDRVHKVLKSRSKYTEKRPRGRYQSPLAKLCKCHFCDCQITTDLTVSKSKEHYYLRCTNGKRMKDADWYLKKFGKKSCIQPYNTEGGVMEAIDAEITKLWVNPTIFAWFETELVGSLTSKKKLGEEARETLELRLEKLKKRKAQLIIMKADGDINDTEYGEAIKETRSGIESLERQIVELTDSNVDVEDMIEITLNVIDKLESRWPEYPVADKCEVLRIMIKKIILGKDGKNKPDIKWEKPWDILMSMVSGDGSEKENRPIESNWYARIDSNCRPTDS